MICEYCGSNLVRVNEKGTYFWICEKCGSRFHGEDVKNPRFADESERFRNRVIREVPLEEFLSIVTPEKQAYQRIFFAMSRHYLTLSCPQCGGEINYRDTGTAVHERVPFIVCPQCGFEVSVKQDLAGIFLEK